MTRLRAKREGQIRGVIEFTAGMYGDLQGIAGKTLEEIDCLVQIADGSKHDVSAGLTPRRVTEPITDRGRQSSPALTNLAGFSELVSVLRPVSAPPVVGAIVVLWLYHALSGRPV